MRKNKLKVGMKVKPRASSYPPKNRKGFYIKEISENGLYCKDFYFYPFFDIVEILENNNKNLDYEIY